VVTEALLAARPSGEVPSAVGTSAAAVASHISTNVWITGYLPLALSVLILVAGVAALAVQFMTLRRVRFHLEASAPLAAEESRLRVAVGAGDKPVLAPWMASLVVQNLSRREIGKSDFDSGKPLVLDLGVPIVAPTSASPGWAARALSHEGSQLRIGPEEIPARGSATISVLTDGEPQPSVVAAPLVNISVVSDRADRLAQRMTRTGRLAAAAGLIALGTLAGYGLSFAGSVASIAVAGVSLAIAGVGIAFGTARERS
jgi:hypothetical protein